MDPAALERNLYVVRRRVENEIAASDLRDKSFFYIPSLSSRTIVYKGLLLAPQMLKKGKLNLMPRRTSTRAMKEIFSRVKKMEAEQAKGAG